MSPRISASEQGSGLLIRSPHLRLVHPLERPASDPPEAVSAPPPSLSNAEPSNVEKWWLDALSRGESAALTRLYREHHAAVRALVRRLLGRPADVEDVVHDVFVAAPAAFRNYRAEGSVRSYLFTIAVNHARRHLRGAMRRRTWLERLHLARTPEPPPAPDTENERRELADRLHAALAALSFEHRSVVVLCEIEELTSVEAAQVLGIPEGTVRTRLFHAKKKLKASLSEAST